MEQQSIGTSAVVFLQTRTIRSMESEYREAEKVEDI